MADSDVKALQRQVERLSKEVQRLEAFNADLQSQVKLANAKLQLMRQHLIRNAETQTEISIEVECSNRDAFQKEIIEKCKPMLNKDTNKQDDLKDMLIEMKKQSSAADYFFDEKSNTYISRSTGWFYYPESQAFFNPKDRCYYRYNETTKNYELLYKLEDNQSQNSSESESETEEGQVISEDEDEDFKKFAKEGDFSKFKERKTKKGFSWKKVPEVRMIVQDSESLDIGSLLLVGGKGGKIGRHQNCAVTVPDNAVSQIHAEIVFDIDERQYYIQDLDSKNGTFVNMERLKTCEKRKLKHNDIVVLANSTQLLVHIHESVNITCDNCEPGVILKKREANTVYYPVTAAENKSVKSGLNSLKRKYGLKGEEYSSSAGIGPQLPPGYTDRAAARQKEVGSDNPYEKTAAGASLDVPLNQSNKGFQMLQKMGWKTGNAVGAKANSNGYSEDEECEDSSRAKRRNLEPIELEIRETRAGLGFGQQ